jgi:hypothetical protein
LVEKNLETDDSHGRFGLVPPRDREMRVSRGVCTDVEEIIVGAHRKLVMGSNHQMDRETDYEGRGPGQRDSNIR